MNGVLKDIDTNIAIRKVQLMRKDLDKMNGEMIMYELQLNEINKTYRKLLMKDSPVGSSVHAIKYLQDKNKEN